LRRLKNYSKSVGYYFTDDFQEPTATRIFHKVLVVYTLLRMTLVWPLSRMVMSYHSISLPKSLPGKLLLGGAFLANQHVDVFFGIGVLLLVVILFTNVNYIGNLVFFYLTFNLYVINLPIADGSDVVLFMLSLWCIPIATLPVISNERGKVIQKVLYNLALLFCQIQVAYIYFISGLDKLMSDTWRSGVAFDYIRHLEVLYNPVLPPIFASEFWNIIFSWSTILFELSFVFLVWNRSIRLPMLLIGCIFHLFIWIVLSLPDFALIMITSYLVFLKDSDYDRIKSWVKRRLPSR